MNYQKIACWGDSQTFGARSYGCYPLYLARDLNRDTRYLWQAFNLSRNGWTTRDLWFQVSNDLLQMHDTHQACILIGTNDVGNDCPLELTEEYYRQILTSLMMSSFRAVYCGEIPPIWPDGHAFFSAETTDRRLRFNAALRKVVDACPIARLVEFPNLTAECYSDPVHLNESGNEIIADSYAKAIRAF